MINCKGNLVDLSHPKVMGILNITPDSFYDKGRNFDVEIALKHTKRMLEEGADFIDIGGYSSRPGAENISEQEEIDRLIPAIEKILSEFPDTLISVDTFRAKVAEETIKAGACMINDISGGNLDDKMFETVAKLNVPYILMHMKGTPQSMNNSENVIYENLITDINYYFSEKIAQLRNLGVNDIILDPGFGFSKTLDQNYELLNSTDLIGYGNYPLLVGVSRKSMIYNLFKTSPEEALNATTALNMIALQKGTNILRVHDVKEAKEVLIIFEKLKEKN